MSDSVSQSQDHGSLALPWFTALLASLTIACFAVFGPTPDALVWDRQAIENGQVWRLVTGHFVHTDIEHLAWNMGAYVLLGGTLESAFRIGVRRQLLLLLFAAATVDAVVHWQRPDLDLYAGLSGVLNAYFVALLMGLWRCYRHPATPLAAVGLVTKIGLEMGAGSSILGVGLWSAVPEAHAAGAVAGLLFGLPYLFRRWPLRPCPGEKSGLAVCPDRFGRSYHKHPPVPSAAAYIPFVLNQGYGGLKPIGGFRFSAFLESDQTEAPIAALSDTCPPCDSFEAPSIVTKIALLASDTAATRVSGESGPSFPGA